MTEMRDLSAQLTPQHQYLTAGNGPKVWFLYRYIYIYIYKAPITILINILWNPCDGTGKNRNQPVCNLALLLPANLKKPQTKQKAPKPKPHKTLLPASLAGL